jgi:predicted KAP-like P-loop ATPase
VPFKYARLSALIDSFSISALVCARRGHDFLGSKHDSLIDLTFIAWQVNTASSMETDVPIIDPRDDRFGYQPFASQLAPSLILRAGTPSLIVGVEAGWGTGKTSFLNLTRHALQSAVEEPLVVDYQPWLYSTIDALLLGFCTQMAAQLENRNPQKFEKIGSALARFDST